MALVSVDCTTSFAASTSPFRRGSAKRYTRGKYAVKKLRNAASSPASMAAISSRSVEYMACI